MFIKITYVYEKDGVIGYACGYRPKDVTIIEERSILYPDNGYELERISDKERMSAVWLKDSDTQDNYTEIKQPEEKENGDII